MRLKHIFVFDEDIDIRNDLQVEWALGTRFQADQDLMVLNGMLGMTMDPSLQGRKTGAKSGFDCTKPFGRDGQIPSIWIKRDDCTGFAGGGNKARKLEYLVADALNHGADVLVTVGAIQSNHARQTAAAAARNGLGCVLLLTDSVRSRGEAYRINGNVLLDQISAQSFVSWRRKRTALR